MTVAALSCATAGRRPLPPPPSSLIAALASRFLSTTVSSVDRPRHGLGRREKHYDVLIVGGGVVGSGLARGLRRAAPSLKLGLIEARNPPPLESFERLEGGDGGKPSARAYALSPASLDFLGRQRLGPLADDGGDWDGDGDGSPGVIDRLQSMGRTGWYDAMQVWESNGPATLNFSAADLAADDESVVENDVLGAVVEDRPLVATLWDDLRKFGEGIDLISPATVKSITAPSTIGGLEPPSPVELTYEIPAASVDSDSPPQPDKRTATASLLVAADGANSYVRRSLSMPTAGWGYGRRAVTCTVELSSSMNRTAFQRFLPEGPIALLPVWTEGDADGDGTNGDKLYANVVWSTTPSRGKKLQDLSPEQFICELNDNLQHGPMNNPLLVSESTRSSLPPPLGSLAYGVETVIRGANAGLTMSGWSEKKPFVMPPLASAVTGPRFAFDLQLSQAVCYVGPRVALAGDAAHMVHPMAGQGLNQGLSDAACLVRVIEEATKSGMDVGGTMQFLSQYDAERRAEVAAAMVGIQALHVAFGMEFAPGVYARSLGMNLVNAVGPVRRQLAEVASGRKGVFR